jgi:hypothetical protein
MVKPNGTKIPNITKTTHACKHATLKDKMEIKREFEKFLPSNERNFTRDSRM